MEAPKCRLCGKNHWSSQTCSAKTKDPSMTKAAPPNRKSKAVEGSASSSRGRVASAPRAKKGPGKTALRPSKRGPATKVAVKKAARIETNKKPPKEKLRSPHPLLKAAKEAGETARKSVKPASKPIAGKRAPAPRARTGGGNAIPATLSSVAPKLPRGRPRKTPEGFDKKTWQREYMREYRAYKKAEREAAERKVTEQRAKWREYKKIEAARKAAKG